jgi:hypothetical protein
MCELLYPKALLKMRITDKRSVRRLNSFGARG